MPPFRSPPWLRTSLSGALRPRRTSPTAPRLISDHPQQQLEEAGPLACRLRSRSVIRLRGPDTVKFLQSLVTNDVRSLAQPPTAADGPAASSYIPTPNSPVRSPTPIYSAMLTPEGRFLYDMFLYRRPRADEKLDRTGSGPGPKDEEPFTVLADVDAAVLDEMLNHLRKCRLRAKVEIETAAKEFNCWQRFGGDLSNKDSVVQEPETASVGWGRAVDHAGESAAQGNNLGWKWFKDPRLDCLGFRGIFPFDTIPPLVESDKETEDRHYLLWRLVIGVAEGSTEIPKGEAIPLEYNLAGLNAISFDKGCYTGQELVARTHHRGVIRKRLLPMKFVDDSGRDMEQEVSPGLEVVDNASNKKVGTVTSVLGCRGMGLLRVEQAFKDKSILSIKGKDGVRAKVIRPDWWPAEWIPVHEQKIAAT